MIPPGWTRREGVSVDAAAGNVIEHNTFDDNGFEAVAGDRDHVDGADDAASRADDHGACVRPQGFPE